jgi:type IV fimbrial biogenesis protein FimT
MKLRQHGFTLIELMVTLAIVGVIASLAAPSFRTLLVKRSVRAAADSLVSDMRFARSEALKRSTRTVICRSTNNTACAAGVGSWSDGWIVFVDMNSNGTVDAGDDLVRVQQALPNIATIQQDSNPGSTRQIFRYEPTGWARTADSTFNFTPSGSVPQGSTRLVCVSLNGRPALRAEGASAC